MADDDDPAGDLDLDGASDFMFLYEPSLRL